jgi:hypothetical protein
LAEYASTWFLKPQTRCPAAVVLDLLRLPQELDAPGHVEFAARDLSALTGIDLTSVDRAVHRDAAEAAALIWGARRLTADQLRQVHDRAHAIRYERADELVPGLRCNCPGPP